MAEQEPTPKPRRGCLSRFATLFLTAIVVGLGVLLFQVYQPQDLSDIEGREGSGPETPTRDLVTVLKNALEGGYQLKLTEAEINRHLRETLSLEQGGLLAGKVSLTEVAVRLEDDLAEVVMVRELAGHPTTTSMYLRVEQSELPNGSILKEVLRNRGPYHSSLPRPAVGGRFGRLEIPEGFLLTVLPAFADLAAVYRSAEVSRPVKELDFIEDMARISIVEGALVLDPRPDAGGLSPFGGF